MILKGLKGLPIGLPLCRLAEAFQMASVKIAPDLYFFFIYFFISAIFFIFFHISHFFHIFFISAIRGVHALGIMGAQFMPLAEMLRYHNVSVFEGFQGYPQLGSQVAEWHYIMPKITCNCALFEVNKHIFIQSFQSALYSFI